MKTSEESFTNRLGQMEERISSLESKVEELDYAVKGNITSPNTMRAYKNSGTV